MSWSVVAVPAVSCGRFPLLWGGCGVVVGWRQTAWSHSGQVFRGLPGLQSCKAAKLLSSGIQVRTGPKIFYFLTGHDLMNVISWCRPSSVRKSCIIQNDMLFVYVIGLHLSPLVSQFVRRALPLVSLRTVNQFGTGTQIVGDRRGGTAVSGNRKVAACT